MSRPTVAIELDCAELDPGDMLTGSYAVDPETRFLVTHVEVAVYWATEGKGSEDRAIQYRKRGSTEERPLFDERGTGPFAIRLPAAPLSYEGVLVKIAWNVEVRVTFAGGGESEATSPFRLGRVGPVAEVKNA
jgi:hypothetical protein